jgi:hypothetical protein
MRASFRLQLFAQEPTRATRLLFAIARTPEPRTEPPCDHPASAQGYQATLGGEVEFMCTLCGRVRDDRLGTWD